MEENIVSPHSLNLAGGRVVVSRDQVRSDGRIYERMKTKARELGVELEILDDKEYRQALGLAPAPVFTPKPGINEMPDGTRCLYISREEARNLQHYLAAKEKASELGIDFMIMPADVFGNGPEAA